MWEWSLGGCVNPNHLSWKTAKENRADRELHKRKPSNFRYKLTPAQVAEIRALEGQLTQQKIADRYSISPNTVSQIHKQNSMADRNLHSLRQAIQTKMCDPYALGINHDEKQEQTAQLFGHGRCRYRSR